MDNSTTKQFQPKKKSPLKPILVSLASLVVVVGIGVATAMLLKQNLVKESTGEQQQTKPAKSAREILEELTKNNAIALFTTEAYTLSNPQGSLVQAKPEGKDYAISIQSKHDARYAATEKASKDTGEAVEQIKKFASDQGLRLVDSIQQNDTSNQYLSFKNSATFCELHINKPASDSELTNRTATYNFVCADAKVFNDQYELASKLLGIYNNSNMRPSQVDILSESQDDIGYHLLYAKQDDKPYLLLFGRVGSTIEYIANLAEGDTQYNNGKYNITPEVRAKISDPKYNGYLLKQIAGVNP